MIPRRKVYAIGIVAFVLIAAGIYARFLIEQKRKADQIVSFQRENQVLFDSIDGLLGEIETRKNADEAVLAWEKKNAVLLKDIASMTISTNDGKREWMVVASSGISRIRRNFTFTAKGRDAVAFGTADTKDGKRPIECYRLFRKRDAGTYRLEMNVFSKTKL